MDPTAVTLVSQLITEACSRFGATNVRAIAVDASVLDEAMDHVLSLGGTVSLDSCVIDGITICELPERANEPLVYLHDESEPVALLRPNDSA